ncbi:hypothetical protein SLS62_002651 [Diatrype stigma]|uniref:Letm1 RBD domain-containing protein n=1 Tax=Diatrype stigma TaxID=117547 RepID=A0AAN9UTV6_9PEZI
MVYLKYPIEKLNFVSVIVLIITFLSLVVARKGFHRQPPIPALPGYQIMMSLHTGLRISCAQTPLLRFNAASAAQFPAARICCTTNTHERRQWMSSSSSINVRRSPSPSTATFVRRRAASTATGAKPKQQNPTPRSPPPSQPNPAVPSHGPPAVPTPYDPKSATDSHATPRDPIPLSATLNPPASTRPPPLELPDPSQSQSKFRHFFSLGKAYMTFYKTGLKAIFTNRRLLASVAPPPGIASSTSSTSNTWPTRAVVHLRARTRHDLARLPVFGVLLVVCGEFTPLLVLLFPTLTPLTCRIPRQIETLRRAAAARREASFRALAAQRNRHQYLAPEQAAAEEARLAPGHIARSLGLTSRWWDRAGLDGPFARGRADRAVAFLARDDAMIRAADADAAAGGGGGVAAIEDEEIVLACEDRGMDVQGVKVGALRKRLEAWVRETEGTDEEESMERVRRLLLKPEVSI